MLRNIKGYLKLLLKQYLVTHKYKVKIDSHSNVDLHSFFEGKNSIGNNTEVTHSWIGMGSYIANNSIIRMTKIGKFCAIGDYVRTSLGRHPTKDFVSIHPAFFSLKKQASFTFVTEQLFDEHKYIDFEKNYVVEIGNDVWIGNNVLIMDGIKISDGAIIAAGSIVTKDVGPYYIVGGVPAKIIRKRFSDHQINCLLEFKWWDRDIDWLDKNHINFSSIAKFISLYKL